MIQSKLRTYLKLKHLFLLVTLPLTAPALAATSAQALGFTSLYVFGDSLSDTGNTLTQTAPLATTQPPLLPFPVPPAQLPTSTGVVDAYFQGRFSNGPVWIDFLSDQLAIPTSPLNFSFAGLTTGSLNTTLPFLPGLEQTLLSFQQTVTQPDPNALYILWAGANDYLGGLPFLDPVNPVAQPVSRLVAAIEQFVAGGAKTIMVANLPDLGQTPLVVERNQSSLVSPLVRLHNTSLAQALTALEPTLSQQGVTLISLDIFSLVNTAIQNPSEFGLTNVTDACLYPSPLFYNPLPEPLSVCANPDEYLFWDSLHPTTAAHRAIADFAYRRIEATAIPEPPVTVGLIVTGMLLSGAYVLRRKRLQAISLLDELPQAEDAG